MFECLLYSEDGRGGGDRTKDSLVSLSTKHPLPSNVPQSGILTKAEALKDVTGCKTCNRVATFHLPRKAMPAEFKDKSAQHTFPGCTWICHRFAAGFVIVDKSKTRSVCTFVSSAGIFGLNRGNL